MFKYTLCFIIQDKKVLMINRNKSPWMGRWNGVGGKIEQNETPEESIIREIYEETGIPSINLKLAYKGIVTWNDEEFGDNFGLHLFLAYPIIDLDENSLVKTEEGILDFKPLEWVNNLENLGVCDNIPYFLPHALISKDLYEYECFFENGRLKNVQIKLLK